MNTRCSIKGASLKAETVKVEDHVSIQTYWLITFKVPADSIDANEINGMVGKVVDLEASAVQTSLQFLRDKVKSGEMKITVADGESETPRRKKAAAS